MKAVGASEGHGEGGFTGCFHVIEGLAVREEGGWEGYGGSEIGWRV